MGEMASGIAHELSQPLAAIQILTQVAIELAAKSSDPQLRTHLKSIELQASHAIGILNRMRSFVRVTSLARVDTNLNDVITSSTSLISHDIRRNRVKLVTVLSDSVPVASIDPVLLQQVIINLIRNAVESMESTPLSLRSLRIHTSFDGDMIRATFSDTGSGIAPEVSAEMFEYFQSTKPAGMGIGLSICRKIIEAHRGRIWGKGQSAGGAEFAFELPVK